MEQPKARPVDDHGVLEIGPTRRRQLRTVVEYVQGIHHHIDPDRFDIDEEWLRAIFDRLDDEALDTTGLHVRYENLLFLETVIDVAGTYSDRRDFPTLDGLDDDDLTELSDWIVREESALFRKPPTIH
jgi:hypothetical protein